MKAFRKFAIGLLLCAVLSAPVQSDPRINKSITVTAGTPIQVSSTKILAAEVFIQMATGGTGVGYICAGIPSGTTPSASCGGAGQLTAQLAPASATAPGGSYSDSISLTVGAGIDISTIWVDGGHSGDVILVSFLQQN